MIRHLISGANTPSGFYSNFDQILPYDDSNWTIYLKGGSGTGKSTLMRKIAANFPDEEIEFIHCSNDLKSLDGLVLVNRKVAIIDGTAPHVLDPKLPGATDEIYNLADNLSQSAMKNFKKELKDLIKDKQNHIARAISYIQIAAEFSNQNRYIYASKRQEERQNQLTDSLLNLLENQETSNKQGKHRKMFLSAITPEGMQHFIKEEINTDKIVAFESENGMGAETILQKISEKANICGYDTEGFYCPLNPNKIEHLIIKSANLSFTTRNNFHSIDVPITYDMKDYLNDFSKDQNTINYNNSQCEIFLNKAIGELKLSKDIHGRVEEIYIANMDFTGFDDLQKSICAKIAEY